MRNKTFYDINQAQSYLQGAVIKLEDEPIFVNTITDRSPYMLSYCMLHEVLSNPTCKTVSLRDKAIDMTAFKLGFINWTNNFGRNGKVVRAFRIPTRSSRIGLHTGNLRLIGESDELARTNVVLYSIPMSRTIKGDYPIFEKCLSMLGTNTKAVAFSRNFAIDKSNLYHIHFDGAVGELLKGEPVLTEDYSYLQEMLEEDLAA